MEARNVGIGGVTSGLAPVSYKLEAATAALAALPMVTSNLGIFQGSKARKVKFDFPQCMYYEGQH